MHPVSNEEELVGVFSWSARMEFLSTLFSNSNLN